MASFSPSSMLIPSWASAPVSAPIKPIFTDVAPPPPPLLALAVVAVLEADFLLELHAVSAKAPTETRATTRNRAFVIHIPFEPAWRGTSAHCLSAPALTERI